MHRAHTRRTAARAAALVAAAGALAALVACAAAPGAGGDADRRGSGSGSRSEPLTPAERVDFPEHPVPDYQLGGAYTPDPDVELVVRDRTAEPAAGVTSVCYVNAFQTQPGELEDWPDSLILRNGAAPVMDPAWPDEALLDTSTAERRAGILGRVAPWIADCADRGFQGVEFDNLDSFARSEGRLTLTDNLALAEDLARTAHEHGLAAGQKNAAEHATEFSERAGFDFAVAEECAAYGECGAYTSVYGGRVIDIEYPDDLPRPFAELCADHGDPAWMILRDRELAVPGSEGFVRERCAPGA